MSPDLALPPPPRWRDGGPALLSVAAVHGLLLAAVVAGLHAPVDEPVVLPTLAGLLVAEPTETVQPPPPVPRPKPRPQPAARPAPMPPPVQAPPTERSIEVPDTPPDDPAPEPVVAAPAPPAPSAPPAPPAAPSPASDADPLANAPVAPPMANASHLNNPAPVYPAGARRRHEEGTVQLRLLVLADGTVGEISLGRTSGYPELDASALKAVARWRFVPASRGGVPIDWRYTLPVSFKLQR